MMSYKNTPQGYGSISKLFHWGTFLILIGLFTSAYFMMGIDPSPTKWQVYGLHKSFGLLILILTLTRLLWRLMNTPPRFVDNMTLWQVALAHCVHFFLYVLLLAMPISGYVMSTASGREVFFFNWKVPALFGKNEALAETAHQTHEIISYIMIGTFVLHVIGALWHHFYLKDSILRRMMPSCKSSCETKSL